MVTINQLMHPVPKSDNSQPINPPLVHTKQLEILMCEYLETLDDTEEIEFYQSEHDNSLEALEGFGNWLEEKFKIPLEKL